MTATPIINTDYATREQYLNAFVDMARPHFERVGYPLPERIRVSIGFTSAGKRSRAIGECWHDAASADGHFEIFIKPTVETDARICDILTHELCHAAVGLEAGHGPTFKKCAYALGLEGRATSTVAGTDWYIWALPIMEHLGAMPYAALTDGGSTSAPPKQPSYLLKGECPVCSFTMRVTRKHVDPHSHLNCPVPDCIGVIEIGG